MTNRINISQLKNKESSNDGLKFVSWLSSFDPLTKKVVKGLTHLTILSGSFDHPTSKFWLPSFCLLMTLHSSFDFLVHRLSTTLRTIFDYLVHCLLTILYPHFDDFMYHLLMTLFDHLFCLLIHPHKKTLKISEDHLHKI